MAKPTFLLISALFFFNNLFAQVEGDVVNQTNKSLPNAILTATDSTGKLIDTAMTDNRGFYFFKTLKPGKYNIEVKATGYTSAIFKNIKVEKELKMKDEWDDTYYAVRLDITLKSSKPQK